MGNRTAITDTNGHVTTFAYDALSRLVAKTDPLSRTTTYEYDPVGNRVRVVDPKNHIYSFTHDALRRLTSRTDPLGNTTTFTYDPVGNKTRISDANGNSTWYDYNEIDRLIQITDALSGTVAYTYDARGNRVSMTDAKGRVTFYTYDAANRLLTVTDPLSHTTSFGYDAVGNMIAKLDPNGNTTIYGYDGSDRLVGVTDPDNTVEFAYDALDNRVAMTDTTGVSSYTYDALSRPINVIHPGNGIITYTHDAKGNTTGITYPDGKLVAYVYDDADHLSAITDWAGRTYTCTYDAADNLAQVLYPNGARSTYAYDKAGRLVALTQTSPVSGTLSTFAYTLDNVGNRVAMTDAFGTTDYTYDDLYRLTAVSYPDGEAQTYAYDAMGNRTAMTSTVTGVVTYTYDDVDRLLATGHTTFTWDSNGNMLSRGPVSYTYDAANRLVGVVSGTTTVQFVYDGDGDRTIRLEGGHATTYTYGVLAGLSQVLAERKSGEESAYLYGPYRLAIETITETLYYHPDGLGSVVYLTDDEGKAVVTYRYDAFGSTRGQTGSSVNTYTFAGEQIDPTLNLQYLRARWYEPLLGRFLTRDLLAGYDHDIQSLNRYPYARNNPVGLIDPSGYDWLSDSLGFWGDLAEGVGNLGSDVSYASKNWNEVWPIFADSIPDTAQRAARALDLPQGMREAASDAFEEAEYYEKNGQHLAAWTIRTLGGASYAGSFSGEVLIDVYAKPVKWAGITAKEVELVVGAGTGQRRPEDLLMLNAELYVFEWKLPRAAEKYWGHIYDDVLVTPCRHSTRTCMEIREQIIKNDLFLRTFNTIDLRHIGSALGSLGYLVWDPLNPLSSQPSYFSGGGYGGGGGGSWGDPASGSK